MSILGAVFGTIGSAISGFFGFRKNQSEALGKALKLVDTMQASEAAKAQAQAAIITAEATNGYWLSAVWRPLLMVVFAGLVVSRWFGYMPSDMSPAELDHVYTLLELGISGYIGGRTIEKVVASLNLGSVLKKFVDKNL